MDIDDVTSLFKTKSGARLLIILLRALAEKTDNQLDDAIVDAVELALNEYL